MSGIFQALLGGGSSSVRSWAFRSVSSPVTGANPTVLLPSGHTAGDLLVIVMSGANTNVTTPAGWSAALNSTSAPRLCIFYKIDSGAESNVSITGASSSDVATMLAYSGINATPLDTNGTAMITFTTHSLTTTRNNSLVISAFALDNQSATWTTIPANTTVRFDSAGNSSYNGLLVVDENQAVAGATTIRTAATNKAGTKQNMAVSFKGT